MFGNQKGGVGKTTLTALAAGALSNEPFNRKVTVLDLDQQQSFIRRRLLDQQDIDSVPPYKVFAQTQAEFEENIQSLDAENDFIFIDAPGKLDTNVPANKQQIIRLLNFTDILVIPFTPGNYSLDASIQFLKNAMKVRKERSKKLRPLQIIGTVNMFEGSRTLDDRFLIEEINDLKEMVNIPFMESNLNRYALFRIVDTLETFYSEDTTEKAQVNFTTWFNELMTFIKK
jgi:cellulose biosynthesis protein BcsQ